MRMCLRVSLSAAVALVALAALFVYFRNVGVKKARQRHGEYMRMPLHHLGRGNEFLQRREYEAAAEEFSRALEYYPGWPIAQQNFRVAMQNADPIGWVREHPEDDDTRLKIWSELFNKGQFEEARKQACQLKDENDRLRCVALVDEAQSLIGPAQVDSPSTNARIHATNGAEPSAAQ